MTERATGSEAGQGDKNLQNAGMVVITKCAQRDDVSVACQIIGNGPIDLVYAPDFIPHMDYKWNEQRAA